MHMPDGYMNVATSVAGAAVAAGGIWASLKADRQAPGGEANPDGRPDRSLRVRASRCSTSR